MGKIATHGEIVTKLGLVGQPPFANKCATRESLTYTHKWAGPPDYPPNRLVELSMVEIKIDGVLFTVTIDNRNSGNIAANLVIANRAVVAPGVYAFRTKRQVGYTTDEGITNHNTGPFDPTEIYGSSNVLLWTGSVGFNYSYSSIEGTSGIIYASAGSGTYSGANPASGDGDNLEYITLFSQSINPGDSISISMIIY